MSSTLQPLISSSLSTNLHGSRIASVAYAANSLLLAKLAHQASPTLSEQEKSLLAAKIETLESARIQHHLNFSRAQAQSILRSRDAGEPIEFETFGPYLVDYIKTNGVMTLQNLTLEDTIGLRLAAVLRTFFPKGRLVSLYDEYNNHKYGSTVHNAPAEFTAEMKANFKKSLIKLFKSVGAIPQNGIEKQDFLLLAESKRRRDAEELVDRLARQNFIRHHKHEIFFINEVAENPLHRQIRLRTKSGKWTCVALDAAAFQQPENLAITHIVVLPDYMRAQQDQVWEILRVLGLRPDKYHNFFFDPTASPDKITQTMRNLFLKAA